MGVKIGDGITTVIEPPDGLATIAYHFGSFGHINHYLKSVDFTKRKAWALTHEKLVLNTF